MCPNVPLEGSELPQGDSGLERGGEEEEGRQTGGARQHLRQINKRWDEEETRDVFGELPREGDGDLCGRINSGEVCKMRFTNKVMGEWKSSLVSKINVKERH